MKTVGDGASWPCRRVTKPASVWCFEPVCESGRTLFWHNAVVAFRREVGEHEKECRVRKTDARDCQWLAELLAHGLIKPSFVFRHAGIS
jgi:hypothetical protein